MVSGNPCCTLFQRRVLLGMLVLVLGAWGLTAWLKQAQARRRLAQASESFQLVCVLNLPELDEVSGMVRTPSHADGFWLHNDSGGEPELYFVTDQGELQASVRVHEGVNRDWEDLGQVAVGEIPFLVVGDLGDNGARRDDCELLFLPEPTWAGGATGVQTIAATGVVRLPFQFEGGPRNCEALAVDPAHRQVLLVEKTNRPRTVPAEAGVFAINLPDLTTGQSSLPATQARRIGTLPIDQVTGMDLSADGTRLIVRDYFRAHLLERGEAETWEAALSRPVLQSLDLPRESQGEAICFSEDARYAYITSEFTGQPLWKVTLPGPVQALARRDAYVRQERVGVPQEPPAKPLKELILPGEAFRFQDRVAFIFWPEPKLRKTPQPWVFYAPTLPGYPDQHEKWMHEQFLQAGIAVAGVDVGEAYGSPESRQVFEAFYEHLVQQRSFSSRPALLGRSRGGLWTASWAADHPDRFACLAGIYPVFDWRTYPGIDKAAPAYGLTPESLVAQAENLNPIARASRLASAQLPVFMIHGDQDTVVPLKENSQAMADAYSQANSSKSVELEVVAGQGHNYWEGFFRSQRLVDFVIRHMQDSPPK